MISRNAAVMLAMVISPTVSGADTAGMALRRGRVSDARAVAHFAITADPSLVFTSNVFAILGLRSLYFALANMIDRFGFLKVSLAMVLAIAGLKMLLAEPLKAGADMQWSCETGVAEK